MASVKVLADKKARANYMLSVLIRKCLPLLMSKRTRQN